MAVCVPVGTPEYISSTEVMRMAQSAAEHLPVLPEHLYLLLSGEGLCPLSHRFLVRSVVPALSSAAAAAFDATNVDCMLALLRLGTEVPQRGRIAAVAAAAVGRVMLSWGARGKRGAAAAVGPTANAACHGFARHARRG